MSNQDYIITWFDELVQNFAVQTSETFSVQIDPTSRTWLVRLQEERRKAERVAKQMIYNSTSTEEGATLAHNYHNALVNLIGRLQEMVEMDLQTGNPRLELCLSVQKVLEAMLHDCERLFAHLVTEWYGVPITRLLPLEFEVEKALLDLAGMLEADEREEQPIRIINNLLQNFVQRIRSRGPISRKELNYFRGILEDLQNIHHYSRLAVDCPIFHEMLLYWNLNSRSVIEYFISCHDMVMDGTESVEARIDIFRQKLKLLDQIPQKLNFIYDEGMPSLRDFFKEYLIQEIRFLQEVPPPIEAGFVMPKVTPTEPKRRVRVHLSLDQVSIALKSLLELGVLDAPSIRYAFQTIVSGLSTPNSEKPSWDSARKRAYEAESRDIEVMAALFERLALHLRSNR